MSRLFSYIWFWECPDTSSIYITLVSHSTSTHAIYTYMYYLHLPHVYLPHIHTSSHTKPKYTNTKTLTVCSHLLKSLLIYQLDLLQSPGIPSNRYKTYALCFWP